MKDYFAYLQIRFLLVPRNYLRDDKAAGSEGGFPRRTRRNVGNCDCMPPVTSIVLPFGQDRKKRVPVIAEHRWLELFHPSVALYVRQRLPRWIFHSCIHTHTHIYTYTHFSFFFRRKTMVKYCASSSSTIFFPCMNEREAFPSLSTKKKFWIICKTYGDECLKHGWREYCNARRIIELNRLDVNTKESLKIIMFRDIFFEYFCIRTQRKNNINILTTETFQRTLLFLMNNLYLIVIKI